MNVRRLLIAVSVMSLLATGSASAASPQFGAFGLDLTARDLEVRPGDDFWTYANGGWSARTPITSDADAVGVAPALSREGQARVHALLEDLARDPGPGALGRQVGDLYASWMDAETVERRALTPVRPYLARIAKAGTLAQLQAIMADVDYAAPIAFGVAANPSDPTRNIVTVGQGDLGMPRDYFLNPDARYVAIRRDYQAYVARILTAMGAQDPTGKAALLVRLETRIAQTQLSPAERRNGGHDRFMPLKALEAQFPLWNWPAVLTAAGFSGTPELLMSDDTALQAFGEILAQYPLSVWKDYLGYRFISTYAEYLPGTVADAHFAFYSTSLSGIATPPPRWRRGVALMNQGGMGDAVGAAYVARYFPPDAERQVRMIFNDVRDAFRARIEQSPWMDASTKAGALEKLETLRARIGSSGEVPDYSGLRIAREDLLGNVLRLNQFNRARERESLAKVNVPDFPMTPQDTNGFYYAAANSITLDAGLLRAPFFDPAADPAVNYGAIGVFIGHEMGHAFDDQGSRYDAQGRVRDWWSPSARRAFGERIAALKSQYDGYEALPGLKVDGALTLGENIADLGGLEAAFAAYQRFQARTGPAPVLGGLTGEQRFFLAQAQTRRTKLREDVARQLATVDTHAPSMLRVNAVVRNNDAWYAAFGVGPQNRLYLRPDQRVRIW